MKLLHEILGNADVVHVSGDKDVPIQGITYDSRRVEQGYLFVAIPGEKRDGHDFVDQAVGRGAVAVAVQRDVSVPESVTVVKVGDSRKALADLSASFWDNPSSKMKLIGVTGTNGKTTTTHLIKAIIEAGGHPTGLIGTIHNMLGDRVEKAIHTTPESSDLQALLRRMLDLGISHAVMEVSSHSIVLERIRGLDFDIGVFTNITQDHLDFHGTFENYLDAKARFFQDLGTQEGSKSGKKYAIVNVDDPNSDTIMKRATVPVVTYGLERSADVVAEDVRLSMHGLSYKAKTAQGQVQIDMKLAGRFNVYNSLAAVASGVTLGIPLADIEKGLHGAAGVPGRFETVDNGQDFTVIVDYAHTPDGLENILRSAREFTRGKVIVVFGCGGDRDRGKRPIMGAIASRLADHIVITSDNPRSENPEAIAKEIEIGVVSAGKSPEDYEIILDRKEAIRRAIGLAAARDTVIIAGKGHETYQIFRDRTIDFDDRLVAREILQEGRV
ncbi:MAG: UDP-N-acetylmuramoyl-L-alanyl-D-glutamate--2,6-diaminopimelate ligase [Firmicutes bacterium]|nr:UDP-N-acetylmuramoyl-L-alanyl-D-glutamate--2,6-diaminopimelate ligase [Bacillota bacterium]